MTCTFIYIRNMCIMSKRSYQKIIEQKMRHLFTFSLMLVTLGHVFGAIELPEHLKGPARILRKTCQAEVNISEELIENSKNGYLPENRDLQCYIECLFRTVGMYDEAGNIKFDEVVHLLPTEIKEKLVAVSAKCQTIHGSDKCETAWLTVKCYFEADPENSMLP